VKGPERNELITDILEALDESITPSDSAGQFLIAATVADIVIRRYKIKKRRAKTPG
jgi:hypothetical protein